MAALNFGFRQSTTESYDGSQSRHVPSSLYSGPGPEFEAPFRPVQPMSPQNGVHQGGRNGYHAANGLPSPFTPRPRNSDALNISDPIAMHLLTETALGDSKNYEVLSFEELEQLKREKAILRNRIEVLQRKLALENKLRDAAQSLNRLYAKGRSDNASDRGHRRNLTGSKSSNSEMATRAEDELTASNKKVDELAQELKRTELKLQDTQQRILEHTAGILQITHRGLKKNLRRVEMPRSPESMASPGRRSISGGPILDEFDERSLYPVPDYVNDFIATSPMTPMLSAKPKVDRNTQALDGIGRRLQELTSRMQNMVLESDPGHQYSNLPNSPDRNGLENTVSGIDGQLAILSQGLDTLSAVQQRTAQESDNVNSRVRDMLEKTNSVSRSPINVQGEFQGDDVASQLAFSTRVLEQLHSRVEALVEQKDILTRQIQQQRELNTKSDAQRDAQIHDLTEELAEAQRLHAMSNEEAQQSQNQISQLINELDRSRSEAQLVEQQRGMNDKGALEAERKARKEAETKMLADIEAKQHMNTELQADLAKIRNDFEVQSQQRIQQINDLSKAKEEADNEVKQHQSESEKLLEQIASIQTELTLAKAELDGAYGSRAQRAADASSNPAIQKQFDNLRTKNSQLQQELKDTIEDYEQMTKASIEFEKERDNLEASIDSLRDKCETLESQLSEEKLKQMGTKSATSMDTTSTMVLKNEFKKMMRDTRSENTKALRAEQDERRRLESIIRQLKRDMGLTTPSKSTAGASNLSVGSATPA